MGCHLSLKCDKVEVKNMKKKYLSLICFLMCCGEYSKLQATEKVGISSGRAVRSAGQVKVVGIGSSILGRRRFGAARMLQFAPSTVKVQAPVVNSEFKLGEVYVYPNPAKSGQIPTFHVEAGLADTVKITVYTVSGDIAHNYTITGQPGTVNDGNGLDYAYEYAWRGHIPSGVYYFIAEAQKAGKKLRKTGRFAVVR